MISTTTLRLRITKKEKGGDRNQSQEEPAQTKVFCFFVEFSFCSKCHINANNRVKTAVNPCSCLPLLLLSC